MPPKEVCQCIGTMLVSSSCIEGDAGACETAAALLGMADEAGLSHLRAVALDFVVMHFEAVAKTTAWASLPRACADAVAAEVRSPLNASRSSRIGCLGGAKMSEREVLAGLCGHTKACSVTPPSPKCSNLIAVVQDLCGMHAALVWYICVQATSRFKHSMELMRKMTAQSKAAVQDR